jgi:hypothetical protein
MQLVWLAVDDKEIMAVATTHLVRPREKVCVLTACAGYEREQWLPLFAASSNTPKTKAARR